MNVDLKRVREDQFDNGLAGPSKRRALGLSTPPPAQDSDDDQPEEWMKVVEIKRKEAIYRQMLEYKRSSEREASKASALEAQVRTLKASVHGVEVCWAQLVAAVQSLAGPPDVEVREEQLLKPALDPQQSQTELEQALQTRLPPTRQLVQRFVELSGKSGLRPASTEDLSMRCMKHQSESSTLRANSQLLQSQISTLTQSRESVQRDLAKAEKALDKKRMEFDRAEEAWKAERLLAASSISQPRANGSGHNTPNGKMEEDVKPYPNGAAPSAADLIPDTTEAERLAVSRLEQLQQLRRETETLQQELDQLRLLSQHPSEAQLRESPFFQVYLHQLATQSNRANSLQTRFETSEKKLDELRDSNFDFREAVLAEARTETDTLRQQLAKKDADLIRVRSQRDDMNAELQERKAKDGERLKYADQMEALARAREERLTLLSSEVRRLKGKLAAEAGHEGYLAFLQTPGGVEGDYVKDLESQLRAAQDKILVLSSQLESSSDAPASRTESEIRIELENARRTLSIYGRVLGPNAEASAEIQNLARRVELAQKEKEGLEMRLLEAEASTNALYTEVEGLSKLWEGLEHQVKNKVYDLKEGEMKVSRLITEKAKADNKYFAAMRTKEAMDAECKTAQRSVEKQLKLLERAQEVERSLSAQIASHEKGITSLKNSAIDLQTQLASVHSEKSQLESRLQQSQALLADSQKTMQLRVSEAVAEKEARAKLEEEVESANRAMKKIKEKQEALVAVDNTNMSAGEWQMRQERDKLLKLLRCSCCEQNFKQQVITKCMHTFCKPCLDSRVASRQRKCPACGLAFSKEEVHTLYWQ
ncbi:E3 ubiquitin-protein ligase BRE1, partial [Tremellales sp. Uapishka_1]